MLFSLLWLQFEVYPLWLCPMKVEDHGEYFIQPAKPAMYVDVGAYGNPAAWPKPPHPSPAVQCVRKVEDFVRDCGGTNDNRHKSPTSAHRKTKQTPNC